MQMGFALLLAQTLVLVAGLALLGQGVVSIFNWPRRRENPVYRLFEIIASPIVKLVRLVSPKVILDRHIPIAAFLLLFCTYFWLGFEHRSACRNNVSQAGCEKWADAWRDTAVKQ